MLESIDLVLRTVSVSAAVLLAALLLTNARRQRAALPGAGLCFAIAAFFVTSAPGGGASLGIAGVVLTSVCVTKAFWFRHFARALFDDAARWRRRDLAIGASVAVVGTWQQIVFLPAYRSGIAGDPEILAGLGFDGALLVLVVLGLHEAWRGMHTDLVERRRRLRMAFMLGAGSYLATTLAVQAHNLLLGASTPILATRANMVIVVACCLVAAGSLLQFRGRSWLEPARATSATVLTAAESAVLERLERALEADRVYLEEGLTIGALAGRLRTSEPVLRRVINRGMGHRNFNDFLHAWRIHEACEELARPEQSRQPVLSIAMKVGYGSVGAFNRAFKARVGMTPTDYRQRTAGGTPQPR